MHRVKATTTVHVAVLICGRSLAFAEVRSLHGDSNRQIIWEERPPDKCLKESQTAENENRSWWNKGKSYSQTPCYPTWCLLMAVEDCSYGSHCHWKCVCPPRNGKTGWQRKKTKSTMHVSKLLIKHIVWQMDTINGCLLQMLWLSKHWESKNQGGNSIEKSRMGGWVHGGRLGDQGEFVLLLEIMSGEFDAEDECWIKEKSHKEKKSGNVIEIANNLHPSNTGSTWSKNEEEENWVQLMMLFFFGLQWCSSCLLNVRLGCWWQHWALMNCSKKHERLCKTNSPEEQCRFFPSNCGCKNRANKVANDRQMCGRIGKLGEKISAVTSSRNPLTIELEFQ